MNPAPRTHYPATGNTTLLVEGRPHRTTPPPPDSIAPDASQALFRLGKQMNYPRRNPLPTLDMRGEAQGQLPPNQHRNTTMKTNITRDFQSSIEDYEAKIADAIWSASAHRRSSKVCFDFDDEGRFETARKTTKYATAVHDMANALKFGYCKSVRVFPNANKSVTVKCA